MPPLHGVSESFGLVTVILLKKSFVIGLSSIKGALVVMCVEKLICLCSDGRGSINPTRAIFGFTNLRSYVSQFLQSRVPFSEKFLAFSVLRLLGRSLNKARPLRESGTRQKVFWIRLLQIWALAPPLHLPQDLF